MPRDWIDIHDPNLMGKLVLSLARLEYDLVAIEKVWLSALRTSERIGHHLEQIFEPYSTRWSRPRIDRDIVLNALQIKSDQSGRFFIVSRIEDLPCQDSVLQIYAYSTELRINNILPLSIYGNRSDKKMTISRIIISTAEPIVTNSPYDRNIRRIIPEIFINAYFGHEFDFSSADYVYVICPQKDIREEYEKFCPLLTHLDVQSPYYLRWLINAFGRR